MPPGAHIHMIYEYFQDGNSTTVLGSPCQCLSMKNFSLISNPKLPWHNLRTEALKT